MHSGRKALHRPSCPEAETAEMETKGKLSFPGRLKCTLDDFILGTTLGTGTFGRVRLAEFKRHEETERSPRFCALKILKKREVLRLKQLSHIKNEVFLLKTIDHPFIVNMVNQFHDDTKIYMVLEFVPGGELFSHLRREGRLGSDEARFFASQVVLAFGYLQSKKIAYRDLKPENLLITKSGYLKIADFGFAKVIKEKTWTLCGTPEYLAPEVIQSKGHGCAVDWWAFGVLCYEMLVGYPPFYDDNPFAIYQKILKGNVEWPKFLEQSALQILKKLLTADLSKRIGCLKGGIHDVQKMKWFSGTNWEEILSMEQQAFYVPKIAGEGDTKNFDDYPESRADEDENSKLTQEQSDLFSDFDIIT